MASHFEKYFVDAPLGLSIWQFMEDKHKPIIVTDNNSGAPALDARSNYLIVYSRQISLLNDEPYTKHKLFYWIGSKNENHERNFNEVASILNRLNGKQELNVEFQYNESMEFFSLFPCRIAKDRL